MKAIAAEDGARWLGHNIRVQYREPREIEEFHKRDTRFLQSTGTGIQGQMQQQLPWTIVSPSAPVQLPIMSGQPMFAMAQTSTPGGGTYYVPMVPAPYAVPQHFPYKQEKSVQATTKGSGTVSTPTKESTQPSHVKRPSPITVQEISSKPSSSSGKTTPAMEMSNKTTLVSNNSAILPVPVSQTETLPVTYSYPNATEHRQSISSGYSALHIPVSNQNYIPPMNIAFPNPRPAPYFPPTTERHAAQATVYRQAVTQYPSGTGLAQISTSGQMRPMQTQPQLPPVHAYPRPNRPQVQSESSSITQDFSSMNLNNNIPQNVPPRRDSGYGISIGTAAPPGQHTTGMPVRSIPFANSARPMSGPPTPSSFPPLPQNSYWTNQNPVQSHQQKRW